MTKRQKALHEFFPSSRRSASRVVTVGDADGTHDSQLVRPVDEHIRCVNCEFACTIPSATGPGEVSMSDCSTNGLAKDPRDSCVEVAAVATTTTTKRRRQTAQTCLDFGQIDIGGVTTCGACGMMYNAVLAEDVSLHRRFCRSKASSCRKYKRKGTGENFCDWIESEGPAEELDKLSKRQRGTSVLEGGSCGDKTVECLRVRESANDEFVCYVFRCGSRDFLRSTVVCQLVEALQFTSLLLKPEMGYLLVFVVHVHLNRLVCAVAGRGFARGPGSDRLLGETQNRCDDEGKEPLKSSQQTLCDVPFVWLQNEDVLATSYTQWLRRWVPVATRSTGDAASDFFKKRGSSNQRNSDGLQYARCLVDTALGRALVTLGRHVAYGCAVCPRTQFSYDGATLSDVAMCRVSSALRFENLSALHIHNAVPYGA